MKRSNRTFHSIKPATMGRAIRTLVEFGIVLFIVIGTIPIIVFYTREINTSRASLPLVINTWSFTNATQKAWSVIKDSNDVLSAVEQGCSVCEREQCDGTVGYGGSPDEHGETTLDAMIMDGDTHDVGAVAALRDVKDAISVAKHVLLYTNHTLLVGSQATDFALSMGFTKTNLTTPISEKMHSDWLKNKCQPNFWKNVSPDPKTSCGPYTPVDFYKNKHNEDQSSKVVYDRYNHDTIGMIVVDKDGRIAGGTSTNGARNKIPGRVGDSPIPGSGCFVDRKVGGAAATGDGDVMMRMLPALVTVEGMRNGLSPDEAALRAINRVVEYYPSFEGAIVAVSIDGSYGAACHGFKSFQFSIGSNDFQGVTVKQMGCS